MKLRRLWSLLRASWWLVPSICSAAAIGLSLVAETIDRHIGQNFTAWYLFGGGPDGARSVLSVVATSVLTFSGLVFSITVLVLQLASSQFSPRVLKTFLRDRASQLALGTFVGTFVYALVGLRAVRGTVASADAYVPSLTVWLAVALALGCVGAFIFYINHIAQSIRAIVVIRRIGDATRRTLVRAYPDGLGSAEGDATAPRPSGEPTLDIPHQGRPGVLQKLDEDHLVRCAAAAGVVIVILPQVGDFVPTGSLIASVWGSAERLSVTAVTDALVIGEERTLEDDPPFGIRQLVDIAERALSPGINDPSTAVQAIDEIHDLLSRIVTRRFPPPGRLDREQNLRLVVSRPVLSDYLHLAVDEIAHYGASSLQVMPRLAAMLRALLRVAPPFRRAAIEDVLSSLPPTMPGAATGALQPAAQPRRLPYQVDRA